MTDLEPRPDLQPRGGTGGHARLAIIAAVLIAVFGSSGVAWLAYNKGFYRASDELAPLVQALPGETRRRPENPGGLEVPHQDKLVFERLAPGQSAPRVERLLPPPEEPVAKPAPPSVEVTELPPEPDPPVQVGAAIVDTLANRVPEAPPPTEPLEPEVAAAAPDPPAPTTESLLAEVPPAPPLPEPVPAEAPPQAESLLAEAPPPAPAVTPEPEIAARPPPADPVPEIRAAAAAWRIQLASLTSGDAAKTEWLRLQELNKELLGDLDLNVQKAELSRGTFYRIQAGPLADRAAAQQLCTRLKERKQDCLVVQP